MSAFLNFTPTVRVVLRNPFFDTRYPYDDESAVGVIDSGYEGFLAVPSDVFRNLQLDGLQLQRRVLILANGGTLDSKGTYATLEIPHISIRLDGFIETYNGLDEIILGVEALSHFKLTLDYCSKKIGLQPCP